MIETTYPTAENGQAADLVPAAPPFYVVSLKKLAILHLATLGMYDVYWFYRNWSNYKHRTTDRLAAGRSVWPVARAIFSIFFTHALFREVKAYGRDNAAVAAWNNGWHATRLVLMTIASDILTRMSNRDDSDLFTGIAALAILVPLLTQFQGAQRMINASCGDPEGAGNSRLTRANYAWIVLGVLLWIVIVVGMVVLE